MGFFYQTQALFLVPRVVRQGTKIQAQAWISFSSLTEFELDLDLKLELQAKLKLNFFLFKKSGSKREEDSLVNEAPPNWSFTSWSSLRLLILLANTNAK